MKKMQAKSTPILGNIGSIFRMPLMLTLMATLLLSAATAAQTAESESFTYPMNIMTDSAGYKLYVNEEVLVTSSCQWKKDGSVFSDYTLSMAGQSVSTTLQIDVDTDGDWTAMHMTTPNGPVEVAREDTAVKITANGSISTIALKKGTILFENFTPILMSQAVIAYDQQAGGKQSFPLFIIPSIILEGNLERLEEVTRTIGGQEQTFTEYRYGAPGVDILIYVDAENRLCFGDVPAQHAVYVRDGYEDFMKKEEVDTTVSQPKYEIVIDTNVQVPMRDGLALATDVYRPQADGVFPVILVRTPYKKEMDELQGKYYARRGYVYAVQDCRGRFSSPGKWVPFFNEPNDGYDAVEWLAVQPWSNGKVGMIGASYLGWVQWWAARNRPPHLTTIIPNVSPPDPYFNIPYEYGGFFMLGAIWWADVLEEEATADVTGDAMSKINDKDFRNLLNHLPVIELDSIVLGDRNESWREWIAHPDNDAYWDKASFLKYLGNLDIPVYHQSGWYDGDGIGSKLNYLTMVADGHKNQKLVLGPWGHTDKATRMGPLMTDFGEEAIIDLPRSYTRWLDHWLLGIDNGIDREPLVSIFVMGSNKWLHGDIYPLPQTQFTKYYLVSGGHANTTNGDGRLSPELPGKAESIPDIYSYDPGDPTPSPNLYYDLDNVDDSAEVNSEEEGQAEEESSVEEEIARHRAFYNRIDSMRQDILVYETPPMEKPLTFAGPISAVLYASSSAKDTDWFMRLSMIRADGNVYQLVHGVIRARYRNSLSNPEMLEPGEVYEYRLDMWQTGITVPVGARLRVEVASADFPRFSRNLNTGGHNETETEYIVAGQAIYHDKDHPSHILLPVISDFQSE
jgi:putative CocE/NonD family hydrolase